MGPAAERAFVVPRDLPGPSGGLQYNRRVLESWHAQDLVVAEVPVGGTWPTPDPQARRELVQRLGSCRSALVDGIIASAAADELAQAKAAGVEISVLMHLPLPAEAGLGPAQQRKLATGEGRALKHAHRVICTSEWARRDIIRRYGAMRTAVAPPGADPAPLAAGSVPPQLLFLGAVSERKNPLLLLKALEPVSNMQWSLTLAGPAGPDPQYVETVTAAADLFPGRVELPGPLTGDALERLWERTDLLVLPSLAETYGMVVTEAVARGIPAVVGAGTGAAEALAAAHRPPDRVGPQQLPGTAVDPHHVPAWTAVLREWLSDQTLRRRWRSNAVTDRDRLRPWSETATTLRRALRW
ncbi:glycosyltransferase family 4 protein [Nesterenkonia sphaerica]|nr:glycosyltransferase family 4 protein [Nesterenkonia sphaerica]